MKFLKRFLQQVFQIQIPLNNFTGMTSRKYWTIPPWYHKFSSCTLSEMLDCASEAQAIGFLTPKGFILRFSIARDKIESDWQRHHYQRWIINLWARFMLLFQINSMYKQKSHGIDMHLKKEKHGLVRHYKYRHILIHVLHNKLKRHTNTFCNFCVAW